MDTVTEQSTSGIAMPIGDVGGEVGGCSSGDGVRGSERGGVPVRACGASTSGQRAARGLEVGRRGGGKEKGEESKVKVQGLDGPAEARTVAAEYFDRNGLRIQVGAMRDVICVWFGMSSKSSI